MAPTDSHEKVPLGAAGLFNHLPGMVSGTGCVSQDVTKGWIVPPKKKKKKLWCPPTPAGEEPDWLLVLEASVPPMGPTRVRRAESSSLPRRDRP